MEGIEVFVKVAQAGSFSAAARLLNMPVTTVSGKVAQLEKRLGVTLIHRTTRKLNLTQAGEVYFKRCVRALDEVRAGESELAQTKSEPEGLLRITAPVDAGHIVLAPLVRDFLRAYPKVDIELILTARRVDLIAEGVDLALRAGKLNDSNLIARKFLENEGHFFASSAYLKRAGTPKHPRELKTHSLLRFSHLPRSLKVTNGRDDVDVAFSGRFSVDDVEMVKIMIQNGEGIGLLPVFLCRNEEASGKMVRVLPQWSFGSFALNFVYPPQRFVDPKVRAFIEWALGPASKSRDEAKAKP